ncbi:MAG: hypothetical protein ACRECH_17220 [Nitrososphaerales archaeon]
MDLFEVFLEAWQIDFSSQPASQCGSATRDMMASEKEVVKILLNSKENHDEALETALGAIQMTEKPG